MSLTYMDSDGFDEEEEEKELFPVKCRSCDEEYKADYVGTCKACYENANENQEKLKREIDNPKSKFSFLKLPSPSQDSVTYGHSFGATDIVLVPSGDPLLLLATAAQPCCCRLCRRRAAAPSSPALPSSSVSAASSSSPVTSSGLVCARHRCRRPPDAACLPRVVRLRNHFHW
ncbi:hypothetical protein PIB30_026385 [Stylosanthes scabra]|uniref:Uncharacterized protein n=1 Tax=Stylosanthes scabra TaxID=79078 RepID=A0ABU6RAM2_9FABA|nr:hypothetical protein [Stylosanthes scabra]